MSTNVNFLTWNDDQRRLSSFVVLAAALTVALAGIGLWWFLSTTPAWVYWALVGALALVLAFMAVLLFVPARASSVAAAPEAAPVEAPAEPAPASAPAAPAFEPRVLTLRCGDCGTIFDLTDTGERPLYHTCPGCGAEGALRDEPAEASPSAGVEAAPEPTAAPEPVAAPIAEADIPPVPVKKMKLRCGGCKEVFTIEDTGERPLKRACPHCGRMGQIN